ncbi:acyltransferase family protein [Mangrovibacter phragmitis]|uniref:acyltransferase family protein n=1 Tax=Mangrovibacter phragmitis TaxID=1691903 RepID=UPI00351878B3
MKSINYSYLSRLDHLRFFAALLVIFHHCRGTIEYRGSISSLHDLATLWLRWGATGVSLFLVLSGFLFCVISNSGHKKISYKEFIKNRILRIAPMATILVFIVICINRQNSGPMDILRLLTLQLNTGHPYTGWGHQFYPTGPMWTIAVEFQFYLIFPFLALFMRNNGLKTIIGIIFIFILIKISMTSMLGTSAYYKLYHSIIGRLDQFLVGMIAGYFYQKGCFINKIFIPIVMIITSLIGLTIFMHVTSTLSTKLIPLSFTIEAILWGMLIYGYVCCRISIPKRIDALIAYLGGLSFSMYLLHLVVQKVLYKSILETPTDGIGFVINTLIYILPITIAISALTFNFIEKPFLGLRVKYTK